MDLIQPSAPSKVEKRGCDLNSEGTLVSVGIPLDVPEWSLSTDGCSRVSLVVFEGQRSSASHQQICLCLAPSDPFTF